MTLLPMLWRDEIEATRPGDHIDSYVLGPLRSRFLGVEIPAWLGLWIVRQWARIKNGKDLDKQAWDRAIAKAMAERVGIK